MQSIGTRLGAMMFLQFFIWGAWYTTIAVYMTTHGMGTLTFWPYTVNPIAAIAAPFFVGLVADRYFATQKALGTLHLLGGLVDRKSVGSSVVRGTASSTSPPAMCSTPSTFCVAKNRSAMSPTKNGAAIAAIGFTVYGQCVSVPIPRAVMNTAIVVYHAPQMKNWRNIITDSRTLTFICGAPGL